MERDLLRRDRDDKCFEGLWVQRRAETRHGPDDHGHRRVVTRPEAEREEIERESQHERDLARRLVAPGLDRDAALDGGDSHLATRHDTVQATFVPDGRMIGAEAAEARRGELEVVRLGDPQNHRPRR